MLAHYVFSGFLRYKLLVAFIAGLVILTVACGGGDSEADQQADFCSDLSNLRTDVQALPVAVSSLDRSKIEDALKKVESDVKDVKDSGGKIKSSNSDDVQNAFNDVKDSVNSIGQGGGLSAAASEISSSLTNLTKTIADARSQYNCDSNNG